MICPTRKEAEINEERQGKRPKWKEARKEEVGKKDKSTINGRVEAK